jgi:hypothetical protein
MTLFMDIHEKVEGLTAEAVANAHQADLQVQGTYGVDYPQYWFDEGSGTTTLEAIPTGSPRVGPKCSAWSAKA